VTDAAESAELRAIAIEAAQLLSAPLAEAFRSDMTVDYKVDLHDVVTKHDRDAEQAIRAHILNRWPDSAVMGEEHGASGQGRVKWYVDPIDGTSNFARGIAFWCISIGATVDDEIVAGAILDPVAGNMFSADLTGAWLNGQPFRSSAIAEEAKATLITGYPVARDFRLDGRDRALENFATLAETFSTLRRPGSAALSIAHVAVGWADAACGFGVNAWDVTAAIVLLRQAGGTYRQLPLGKVPADRPDQFHPGYMAWGEGGNYPTLVRIGESISSSRSGLAQERT
jgi:myo-inositol-1(or 4)-monophosphatase